MFSTTLRAAHKADGGGLWRMRLEPPLIRLYRDINQLLASDKIGCSGSECFSKPGRDCSCSSELCARRNFYNQTIFL